MHGDFSPKNILTDGQAFWVTDFEVAHYGDPTFDLGFLVSHLLLKAVADPEHGDALRESASAFLQGYEATHRAVTGDRHLAEVTAALMAARVDGRSPVEYLSPTQQDEIRSLTRSWLFEPNRFWALWRNN